MRKALTVFAAFILLAPAAFCGAPKVTPEKVESATPYKPIRFDVEVAKGKTLVIDYDDETVTVAKDIRGRYIAIPTVTKGAATVTFWYAGETVKLPEVGPLPELPVTKLTITVGDSPKLPPNPKDPPTQPTTGLYFAIIRADGPASPEFTRIARDPAWKTLRDKGHLVKDFSLTDVDRLGIPVPSGTPLPCVVTLQQGADSSRVVRPAIPLPTTTEAILALPSGVAP